MTFWLNDCSEIKSKSMLSKEFHFGCNVYLGSFSVQRSDKSENILKKVLSNKGIFWPVLSLAGSKTSLYAKKINILDFMHSNLHSEIIFSSKEALKRGISKRVVKWRSKLMIKILNKSNAPRRKLLHAKIVSQLPDKLYFSTPSAHV